jgi:hypothetical protein
VNHKPQTVADLAWQLEAFLIADVAIISSPPTDPCDQMLRTLLHHVRTLGAIPNPMTPWEH